MNSGTPIVRQMSWLGALPQLVALLAAMTVGFVVAGHDGVPWGALTYLAYSIGSRQIISRAHRSGVKLVKQQRFEEAITEFQKSWDFFDRHAWIDRFRSVVLMSPSAASYREMALANIGFCYGQIGDGARSRAFYQKCLERFPQSGLATSALRMLNSVAPPAMN